MGAAAPGPGVRGRGYSRQPDGARSDTFENKKLLRRNALKKNNKGIVTFSERFPYNVGTPKN